MFSSPIPIFVMQVSQIMKDDENTTFSNINEMLQKSICVVVDPNRSSTPTMMDGTTEACATLKVACGDGVQDEGRPEI